MKRFSSESGNPRKAANPLKQGRARQLPRCTAGIVHAFLARQQPVDTFDFRGATILPWPRQKVPQAGSFARATAL